MMTELDNLQKPNVLAPIAVLLRAGLSSLPFGGGVAALWSEWDTSRRFDRVESTIRQIAAALSHAKGFDPRKLSDAEMQLLEDALQSASREHREDKRSLFALLLAANWSRTDAPFDERLLFQRALDEFEPVHLQLLKLLSEAHEKGEETVPSRDVCNRAFGADASDEIQFSIFVPALNKLAAEYGFVRRRGAGHGNLFNVNPDGLVFHVLCSLSPLGRRFVDSLSIGESADLSASQLPDRNS